MKDAMKTKTKFMINICYGDLEKRQSFAQSGEGRALMQKYMEWSEKIGAQTVLAHKLKDGVGRKLDLRNGQVHDGPFVETKEAIGGFYIVEAENYDQAVELAKGCPTLLYQGGFVEVREVEF